MIEDSIVLSWIVIGIYIILFLVSIIQLIRFRVKDLSKEEDETNSVLSVVRNPDETLVLFIGIKPKRITINFPNNVKEDYWTTDELETNYECVILPSELFPDLKPTDDPIEVKLVKK